MRAIVTATLVLVLSATAYAQAPKKPQGPPSGRQPAAPKQPAAAAPGAAPAGDILSKGSYVLGLRMGSNLKRQNVPIDTQALIKGLQDGFTGAEAPLTDEQMSEILQAFEQEVTSRQTEKNKAEAEAFLANNAKQPGVKQTKSGLQYKVLKDGTGKTPKATDVVKAHYKGTLLDGTVFDSSYERGEPLAIPVNKVIPGWTEALQMMKVGSKWQLAIPADLAYGPQGSPPVIGPNATLLFDVELLGIEE